MPSPRIVLAGLGPHLDGLVWESDRVLRIGRQPSCDVVVNDYSVERMHAEIKHQGVRWMLRDLANNPIYPTAVNDSPLCGSDRALQPQDIIQVGTATFKVVQLVFDPPPNAPKGNAPPLKLEEVRTSRCQVRVEAAAREPWDRAIDRLTQVSIHGGTHATLPLTQAHHYLNLIAQPEALFQAILRDALAALNAQRGSLLLADPMTRELTLAASTAPKLKPSNARPYSKTLTDRCFLNRESLLCQDVNADPELALSRRFRHGAMASILCALLRTPERSLGVLHVDRGLVDDPFTEADLQHADAIAASVSVAIDAAQLVTQQRAQFTDTIAMLARAVESRDPYTGNHTKRVTDYALLLANELNLPASDRYHIQIGSPLHDIGKIAIDDAILRKPGKLTLGEFEQIKTHTTKGATMLDEMRHLLPMVPIVRHHHEHWDGTGYPDGLARDQIPLTARVVSVADAFAAMTSDRPFRTALPVEQAFLELIGRAGTHFDPACVYAFLRLRPQIEASL